MIAYCNNIHGGWPIFLASLIFFKIFFIRLFVKSFRWSSAFEDIGFKDVIQVRDFPEDDPEFDPETGEIINASVILYNDVVKLASEWRFCQTAQLDTDFGPAGYNWQNKVNIKTLKGHWLSIVRETDAVSRNNI